MRIIKDVIISSSIEPVWTHVVGKCGPNSRGMDGENPQAIEDFEICPPTKLSYRSVVSGHPIITTLELSQRGKRTGLRVTVTGWEKAGPERARMEMPRLSLEWERALALIKRKFEAPPK
jgi:hypothetical protein